MASNMCEPPGCVCVWRLVGPAAKSPALWGCCLFTGTSLGQEAAIASAPGLLGITELIASGDR